MQVDFQANNSNPETLFLYMKKMNEIFAHVGLHNEKPNAIDMYYVILEKSTDGSK